MKLLHVIANNFKNFNDSFEIDFYHDRFIYRYKTIKKTQTVLLSPMLCTAYMPCPSFIHGMVSCMTDNIEACTHQGISEAEVRIEAGISGNSKLRASDNHLLIHKCQIQDDLHDLHKGAREIAHILKDEHSHNTI